MYTRIVTLTVTLIITLLSSFSALGQARIDRLVKEFEKEKDVQVTYTERRDPKTKKLVKQSIILNGNKKTQADKLWEAFEHERANSVSVTKTRDRSFVIKFEGNNSVSSYVLSVTNNNWSLVISKKGHEDDDEWPLSSSDIRGLDNMCLNLDGLDRLENLDGMLNLDALEALDGLDNLNFDNISGNVTVYDSNGNIIYQSTDKPSVGSKKGSKKAKSESKSKSTSKSTSKNGKTKTVTTTTVDGRTITTTQYL